MTSVSFYVYSSPDLANVNSHKHLDYKGPSHNSKVINEFKLMKNCAYKISALITFPFFFFGCLFNI